MRHLRNFISAAACALACLSASAQFRTPGGNSTQNAKDAPVQKISAWSVSPLLGDRSEEPVDTLYENYSLRFIPSAVSDAYATTGNYGAEGLNLIYFERPAASDFFFRDALRPWLPTLQSVRFYNSRIPLTFASYNFGGGKDISQDRLKADFSGNINKRAQVGAMIDYLYSKGSYNYQALKDLSWGFSGSYIGDRYEFQGFWRHYNSLNKENGGIVDDLYITDPAEIQGGSTSVDYKTIPTNLSKAHNRLAGGQLFLNNRYKLGFWRDKQESDSTVEEFVPVTSFIWTLDYQQARHRFTNTDAKQGREFWEHRYLSDKTTHDVTSYWSLRNTIGASLLEGFNKYAKAELTLFLTHEYRSFKQNPDSIDRSIPLPDGIDPLPAGAIAPSKHQNLAWAGGRLSRRQGRILNYNAQAEIGFLGDAAGEVKLSGDVRTNIPLFGDTVTVDAYANFDNVAVPYLLQSYISNHFAWENDFGMTRRLRIGGKICLPWTRTRFSAGVENIQNLVYFDADALPAQCSSSVQVFSATLHQDFKVGILCWNNRVTFQTSSDQAVLPLPKLAVYSNLFITFKVAHALDVQLGVDCDYYTKYKSVAYQPATMTFYNQREIDCGNYPFMNAYINMNLSRTRFYLMFSHVNQGWFGGNNFFSMPHYPLNPRRFQLGLSINFAN